MRRISDQCLQIRDSTIQNIPKHPIRGCEWWPFGRAVQDRERMPEGEILKDEWLSRLENREKGFDRQLEQSNHGQQGCLGGLKDSRAPLKTVLFRDGGVSRMLTSSCIRPYTPVFRARLPCPHQKCLVCRGALK